jgi:hypothetical protein
VLQKLKTNPEFPEKIPAFSRETGLAGRFMKKGSELLYSLGFSKEFESFF